RSGARRCPPAAGRGEGRALGARERGAAGRGAGRVMTLAREAAGTESAADADLDPASRFRRAVEGVIGVPATEGNRVDVLRNGDEIFPAMLDAIDGAHNTVDLLTFVYWKGEVGRLFARALADRATEGVRVRVLLDAWGAHTIERS